jgi:hypothetical protein
VFFDGSTGGGTKRQFAEALEDDSRTFVRSKYRQLPAAVVIVTGYEANFLAQLVNQ